MKTIAIASVTVTTKGKTGHGVEFTLAGVRKHAQVSADVLACLAEGEELEGYRWHAPKVKTEVGYFWKAFASEKEAKAEAKRLRAYMPKPEKAPKAKPETAKAEKPEAKKAPKAKPAWRELLADLTPEDKAELIRALFA